MPFKPKHSADVIEKVIELSDYGFTVRMIADEIGVSKSQVSRYLRGEYLRDEVLLDKCRKCTYFDESTGECTHSQSMLLGATRGTLMDAVFMRRTKNKEGCHKNARLFQIKGDSK